MSTAAAFENVHRDAEYFEYSKAADPISLKLISRVPYHDFPASLYKDGPTRIIPLDLSKELNVDYPATGPGLLAHFVRVVRGELQSLNPVATSQLFYVLAGKGTVVKLSPEGKVLREIDVLGDKPTNLCFGGPDGRTVYVTEVKHKRLVQFRVDKPGLAWQRWQMK